MTRTLKAGLLACTAVLSVAVGRAQSTEAGARTDLRWVVVPELNALDGYNVIPNSTALAKALGDAAEYVLRRRLPQDGRTWREQRPQLEQAFRHAVGLETLPERTPLNARILRSHEMGDHTLENVIFYSRPGFPVTANLYRPKDRLPGKCPAVLAPIGHYLGPGKAAAENQTLCIQLARLGFVVLTYDAIGHGERLAPGNNHHEAGYALLPLGQTIAGWMVWDSMRAIDYLLTIPEVDPARIGVTGNSGGGLNTLFTAALDERVRAAAIAGYVFQFNNWIKYGGPHCTCTYLPGMYRSMEWFEIAGLIAPRALLMMQGAHDSIFPISGARQAGRATEALYALLERRGLARFEEIPEQPHAYSRPYREKMYGWMLQHLLGAASRPATEGDIRPLAEDDPRLLCGRDASVLARAPPVVELARELGARAVAALPANGSAMVREAARRLVRQLTAPPDPDPDNLRPRSIQKIKVESGILEKVYFLSEVGQYITGLLWLPDAGGTPHSTVVIAHDGGKGAAAESGLVEPLLQKGYAILAIDLRGRGETLGRIGTRRDNNYHFVAHSIAWARPVAGRRAFDLKRSLDFVERRSELSGKPIVVVGLGGDALPALLAAADDPRVRGVACAGLVNSFVAQISAATAGSRLEALRKWNSSAMTWGRLDNGLFQVDLGSVIPSVLLVADIPDIASLVAPRRLLYCGVPDNRGTGAELRRSRFERVLKAVEPQDGRWARYRPDQELDASLLLDWLQQTN